MPSLLRLLACFLLHAAYLLSQLACRLASPLASRRTPGGPASTEPAGGRKERRPPPKHVQLVLCAEAGHGREEQLVESVRRAAGWCAEEGVEELSVYEPHDLLEKVHGKLADVLSAAGSGSSTASSPSAGRPPSAGQHRSVAPADAFLHGWATLRGSSFSGDSADGQPAADDGPSSGARRRRPHPPAPEDPSSSDGARRAAARRGLAVHLLTRRAGQPLLTEIARDLASAREPSAAREQPSAQPSSLRRLSSTSASDERGLQAPSETEDPEGQGRSEPVIIDQQLITDRLASLLPFAHPAPDLLIVHRLGSSSDRGLAGWVRALCATAAGKGEGTQLHGVGVWGLRVTEIHQTSGSSGVLRRADWEGAMCAWEGVEQRYGR